MVSETAENTVLEHGFSEEELYSRANNFFKNMWGTVNFSFGVAADDPHVETEKFFSMLKFYILEAKGRGYGVKNHVFKGKKMFLEFYKPGFSVVGQVPKTVREIIDGK